jgi:ubiquinone/menaquinone biosynthesis C-methylase UbiE
VLKISGRRFCIEETIRRQWNNPEDVLKDIGLRSGMVFMDIGCGDGFFSILAAQVVGAKGKVNAVDADASAIESLKRKAIQRGLNNVFAKVGTAEQTVFCDQCADIIFFSIVLHDFADPQKVLLNAKRMLKPSGKLANLDWKKQPMPFGPPIKIRFSEKKASNLIKNAGFEIERTKDAGNYQYIITARPETRILTEPSKTKS